MAKAFPPPARDTSLDRFVQQLEAGFQDTSSPQGADTDAEDADQALAEEAVALLELQRMMVSPAGLAPGDLVRWKPGLKNRSLPNEDQLAVVMEVLPQPVFDGGAEGLSSGTPNFREPLDVKLGIITRSGGFLEYHYDSRRLQVVPIRKT